VARRYDHTTCRFLLDSHDCFLSAVDVLRPLALPLPLEGRAGAGASLRAMEVLRRVALSLSSSAWPEGASIIIASVGARTSTAIPVISLRNTRNTTDATETISEMMAIALLPVLGFAMYIVCSTICAPALRTAGETPSYKKANAVHQRMGVS
jgi:hypothetical protein